MDYSSDDEPLARLVDRLTQSKNADGLLTDSGSDFTPEICGVKNCKSVADNECDHCDMALCKDHSGTTNCDKKHIIPNEIMSVIILSPRSSNLNTFNLIIYIRSA